MLLLTVLQWPQKEKKALFEFTTPANDQVLNLNIYNLPDKNLFPTLKKSRFLVEKPAHLVSHIT